MKLKIGAFVIIIIILTGFAFAQSCKKEGIPDVKLPPTNFVIYPNDTRYISLNTAGGYAFLNSKPPSRGIIVYNVDGKNFVAFDRTPPNEPDKCHNGDIYTHLTIEYPMVVDTCTNRKYLILDGSIVSGGGKYPLVQYKTFYDGNSLRIYN
ncbi:MAG: hypothetical protein ACEPOW_02945 [Bacteroidales bacterium]